MRARKRMEIGLSPYRPTAAENPQRPPTYSRSDMPLRWLLALVLAMLIFATMLLIFARLLGAPTSWSAVSTFWQDWPSRGHTASVAGAVAPVGYRMLTSSTFEPGTEQLYTDEQPGRYRIGAIPDLGIYRIEAWPNQLAWTSPGAICLAPLRMEAEAVVNDATPDGYAGIVARVSDALNYYLFVVDGNGAYQVMVQRNGTWHTLQPWTAASALNLAGTPNTLVADDDGTTLRFGANGVELFSTEVVRLPQGELGIAGGARDQSAVVDFNQFVLFDKDCR